MQESILTDQFGRFHDYLRISLTEKCNLRCVYCMPEDGVALQKQSCYMQADEVFILAKFFVDHGVKKIRLTGGEPLVRKDFGKIIELLSELPIELTMTTNGMLIDRFIPQLKSARIRTINLSLDSLDPQRVKMITRRDSLGKVLENMELLQKEEFKVKLNTVVMKGVNDHEIPDFIELSRDLDIAIRFIEFMPFSGNQWEWEKVMPHDEIMKSVFGFFGKERILRIDDRPNDTSRNFKVEGYKGTFALISTVTKPFCSTCNRIRLTADGKLKNCLFSTGEVDLLSALRNEQSLSELVMNNIQEKKAVRAGMDNLEKFSDPALFGKNRSMIIIGG